LTPGDRVRLVVEPGKKEGTAVIQLKIDKQANVTRSSTEAVPTGLFDV